MPYLKYSYEEITILTSFIVIPLPAFAQRRGFPSKGSDFLFPVQLKVVLAGLFCFCSSLIFSPLQTDKALHKMRFYAIFFLKDTHQLLLKVDKVGLKPLSVGSSSFLGDSSLDDIFCTLSAILAIYYGIFSTGSPNSDV